MTTRIGTKNRKTRQKFKKALREKGKVPLSRYFQTFTKDDKVNLKINSTIQKGQFFRRFHGMTGTITGVLKGTCYEVAIKDRKKAKTLYVHPIHMRKHI
jgi:large subunit ribosomal protein L21e